MTTVTRRVLISAPRDSVRRYLSDLREIANYDPKVEEIALGPAPDGVGATASGRFLGLPWSGTFRFETSPDGGYRGVMVSGPLRGMESRVAVRSVVGGTIVESAETYDLPFPLKPLSFFLRSWLVSVLETKLSAVKEGAEALNRRLQLQSLDV
jgi:Polyketide cyclase / dehydrase and lipid transport